MPFGIVNTTTIDLPGNIDAVYLRQLKTASGETFEAVTQQLNARLGAFNGSQDPLIIELIGPPTTTPYNEGVVPDVFKWQERAEGDVARPQYAAMAGLMIPIRTYDVALGWTEDGLKRMSTPNIVNQMESALKGGRALHRRKVLERYFSNAEIRVDKKTTVTSPGFAGSGTSLNVFPLKFYPDGTPVPGGYTHYHVCTAANQFVTVAVMYNKLLRWYPNETSFDLLGGSTITDRFLALAATDGWVPAGSPLIRVGNGVSEALVDPQIYLGVYKGIVRVRKPLPEITTANFAIKRNTGNLAIDAPLSWRYDDIDGRGAFLRSRNLFPFAQSEMIQTFGVGVNDRLNSTFCFVDESITDYTPPTFNIG